MPSAIEDIMASLERSGGMSQLGRSAGVSESDASSVVAGALPLLLGALNRNTDSSDGAGSLAAALDRDHDGSILDDLAGFLGGAASADAGAGILGHAFGGRQSRVEEGLSRSAGVDAASVSRILAMLAPIVMGYLGRQKRERDLDAGGLSDMLGLEERQARERSPGAFDVLSRMLDADGDGSLADDLANLGSGALGSLFKSRRD